MYRTAVHTYRQHEESNTEQIVDTHAHTHTHTHTILTAIFPGEPGLAGCPLNSPSAFIPGLRILLAQT